MSDPLLPREVRRRLAIIQHAEEVTGNDVAVGVLSKLLPSRRVRQGVPGELCQRCVTERR